MNFRLSITIFLALCAIFSTGLCLGQDITVPPSTITTTPPSSTEIIPPVEETPGEVPPGRIRIRSERQIFSEAEGTYRFIGNVSAETSRFLITADEAEYATATETVTARGNVTVQGRDGVTYHSEEVVYDVTAQEVNVTDWAVTYPPSFIGPPVIGPIFVNGRLLTGTRGHQTATDTSVTTCDLTAPHYYIIAQTVDIYPGNKLIARNTDLYVLGKRVLRLPYFYITLRQRRSPIVPDVGRNDYEGYYTRLLYQYVLGRDQVGGVRVDLTEKLGMGVGVDQFYDFPRGFGELFAYRRERNDEAAYRLDHKQLLPADIRMALRADIRNNSLFTQQSTTITTLNALFDRSVGGYNTSLNYSHRWAGDQFPVDNSSVRFALSTRNWGGNFTYNGEYARIGQTSATLASLPADEELWHRLQWLYPLNYGRLNFRIDQRNDVDGDAFLGDRFFSGLERLPEISLESSNDQLNIPMPDAFPSTFTVGWGRFHEFGSAASGPYANPDLDRFLFDWRTNSKPICAGSTTFNVNAAFRQTFYGDQDNTAKYTYSANATARTRVGGMYNVFNYAKQYSDGFTPFRFDFTYPYETVTDSLQYLSPQFNLYLTGGRDIRLDRWQDATLRAGAVISPRLSTRQALAYDLNNNRWRDLVSQFYWRQAPSLIFNLGTRYDLEGGRFRRISTEVDWVPSDKWHVQWLGGYDGINNELLFNEWLITRDLHCWDLSLCYSLQTNTTFLYLRLKALDIPLPQFGIGKGGQVLDTSQGVPF